MVLNLKLGSNAESSLFEVIKRFHLSEVLSVKVIRTSFISGLVPLCYPSDCLFGVWKDGSQLKRIFFTGVFLFCMFDIYTDILSVIIADGIGAFQEWANNSHLPWTLSTQYHYESIILWLLRRLCLMGTEKFGRRSSADCGWSLTCGPGPTHQWACTNAEKPVLKFALQNKKQNVKQLLCTNVEHYYLQQLNRICKQSNRQREHFFLTVPKLAHLITELSFG